jgi:hypothetical protein
MASPKWVTFGSLDLYDVSAEIAQHHRSERRSYK